jgi:endonuclease YncB( thermonuclease family)
MAFAIQWTGPMGPTSTRRKDPVDALKYAEEMLGKGYADVVIVDLAEDGKAYAPAEFRDLYLDEKK